jgi:hypothetical protein
VRIEALIIHLAACLDDPSPMTLFALETAVDLAIEGPEIGNFLADMKGAMVWIANLREEIAGLPDLVNQRLADDGAGHLETILKTRTEPE